MNITIIGSGNMGSALARRLSGTRHFVVLTGRNPEEVKKTASDIGENVRAELPGNAAANADIIIAATPFREQINALKSLGNLDGKIVVDVSNPLKADLTGLSIGHTTSAAEEISRAFPRAKVVKAFNTIFAQMVAEGAKVEGGKPIQVFYAGDDEHAKSTVRSLIESMGFEPIHAGPLQNARNLEPIGFQNIWFGYVAKQGTQVVPAWLHQ